MKEKERNEKGFTMVELIIVVAIMGVIGALLVPSFGKMAAKSRVSTDVSTVKTIKRLIDAYNAENNTDPIVGTDKKEEIGEKLYAAGYLETEVIQLQTNGELTYEEASVSGTTATPSKLQLNLAAVADANIKTEGSKMLESDKASYENWIIAS